MKVLVTGGAGFIGSHIVDSLLDNNCKVLIIDNLSTGRKENLRDHKNLVFIEGDIADTKQVQSVFQDLCPNIVVHAAASFSDPNDWSKDVETNVIGTINLVNNSRQFGVDRFVYLQTSLCYGTDPAETPVFTSSPLFSGANDGGSSYAISKTCGEQYIALSGLNFVSFRLANTYGPRNLSGPLPNFYKRIKEGKECIITKTRRDFIYVSDVANCIMLAVKSHSQQGYYNISNGTDCAIEELYQAVRQEIGGDIEAKYKLIDRGSDDAFTILIDPGKTKTDFHWTPEIGLLEGIRHSINYYNKHGIALTYTHLKIDLDGC